MPGSSPDPTEWRHANPILEVTDVPQAVTYYCETFGQVPTWSSGNHIAGVSAKTTPIEFYLGFADSPTPSRLSVFVDDADATLTRCQAVGAEIVEEIETKPWGVRRFTMRDPDGNLIDISHEVHDPRQQPQDLAGQAAGA